jgi:hypothetical protein
MGKVVGATIAAKRHLSLARVLANSFREQHPDIPFFVLLADEVEERFDPAAEPYRILHLHDLAVPDLPRFQFHYRQQELTYAATPYLLAHLLSMGFTSACFFKQESLVVNDLSPVLECLPDHSIVLTPHLLKPLERGDRHHRELNILQSGIYNVGLLGVTESETARTFLRWWQDRLYHFCRHNIPQGIHYEQRWLDLVPAFFEDFHILRKPGINVGHWNLPERNVRTVNSQLTVDGELCRFFRFSGFDPDQPEAVTRYSARLSMADIGDAADLFAHYRQLLEGSGYHETKSWPYAYDYFDNGVPIPDLARELYRDLGEEVQRFGDPFRTNGTDSYYHWLNDAGPSSRSPRRKLSPLGQAVYQRRPDVQVVFPDPDGVDHDGFQKWMRDSGAAEHQIPAQFLGP